MSTGTAHNRVGRTQRHLGGRGLDATALFACTVKGNTLTRKAEDEHCLGFTLHTLPWSFKALEPISKIPDKTAMQPPFCMAKPNRLNNTLFIQSWRRVRKKLTEGGRGMGRSSAAVWLSLLLCSLLPVAKHHSTVEHLSLNDAVVVEASSPSNLAIGFSNGPAQSDEIKGTYALTFSVAGTGTLDSLLIEITSDESTWTTVVNLTTTPWMYPFDTTGLTNETSTPCLGLGRHRKFLSGNHWLV